MVVQKNIRVISESNSGRNELFQVGNRNMSRETLARSIDNGNHPNYHTRIINGIKTPVSNPDKSSRNNLG